MDKLLTTKRDALCASLLVALLAFAISTTAGVGSAFANDGVTAGSATLDTQAAVTHSAATKNLDAAQKKYSVDDARTIVVNKAANIESTLKEAGEKASAKSMYIVYAPEGSYAMSKRVNIPANVVFVAEAKSVFTATTASQFTQFFWVYGSLYGGTYKGANKAYYGLRFGDVSFSGMNGYIEKASVSGCKQYGIVAMNLKTKNANVINNTVSACAKGGIASNSGATINYVQGNKVTGIKGGPGINLGSGNMNYIIGNTVKGNKGHGISTDTWFAKHPYCHIKRLDNNIITGNGVNGVYIDKKCKVQSSFANNTISQNKNNGVTVDPQGSIAKMSGNTISQNKQSNIRLSGGAITLGDKNSITGAKTNNISMNDKSKVVIAGSDNKINSAGSHGVTMYGKSTLTWSKGSKNQIKSNKGAGIRIDGNSKCDICNIQFGGNKSCAVRVCKGSSLKQKSCGLSTSSSAKNRLIYE